MWVEIRGAVYMFVSALARRYFATDRYLTYILSSIGNP